MSLRLGSRSALVVSSASLAKEVLKTHDLEFAGRPSSLAWQKLSYNASDIVFSNGACWREMRKLSVVNLFNEKRVQSFSSIREEEVRKMIERIQTKSASSGDKVVNLSALTMAFANRIICRIGFGKAYEDEDEIGDSVAAVDTVTEFQRMLSEVQAMFATFFFSDYIPLTSWVDRFMGLLSRLNKSFEECDRFYERIILDHLNDERPKDEDGQDIINVMLQLVKENSCSISLSRSHIKAVLMNIFVAGSDTTASTLVWAMTSLMKHPAAMEKVRAEIKDVCGQKDFVSEDDIRKLPYLSAVLKETWRMFPTVPLLVPRETVQRCNLNGYEIEPKTLVYVNALAIGRDPEAWEEPQLFKPERFLNSSIDFKGQHYELIPFGAGRRICPGLHMGTASVELALANLVHAFNWALPWGMKKEDIDTESRSGITVHKKIPLCLVASR